MKDRISVCIVTALLGAAVSCGGEEAAEIRDGAAEGAGEAPDASVSAPPDASAEPDASDPGHKDGGLDAAGPAQCVPVWLDSSQRIAISSFGFHEGSAAYEIARGDMSAEQLQILAGLCRIPTPTGPAGADYTSYRVTITDQDGGAVTYRAAAENVIDGDEGQVASTPTLDIESLAPFLSTYHCSTAKDFGPYADAGSRWDGWPELRADPGCSNGIFVGCGAEEVALRKLQIDKPGRYRLSTARCFQSLELRVFAADGTTRLASAGPSAAPDCVALTYQFPSAGQYLLEIVKTQTGANPNCGDFFLRVAPEAP